MRNKLFSILIFVTVVSLLLGACGPSETESPPRETSQTEVEVTEVEEEKEPEELKEVHISVGTYVLNVSYPWLMMPQALGYWEDMGYDVTVEGVGGTLDAVQQVVGGNSDFVQGNSSVVIQSNVKEDIPLRVVHETGVVDWGLVVPKDSDITQIEDFRGKDIGVFNLASGGIPLMQAYLSSEGISKDEYEMIPVGFGPQASDALDRGDVDAVMLWNAALAQLENLGHEFRYFRSERWTKMPDFALSTLKKTIENDRQMVVDIVKGINMAIVFTETNYDCVVRLQWANWPDTKPADVDEETAWEYDMHLLEAQVGAALEPAYELHGSDLWGFATPDEYSRLQDFMLEAGLIEDTMEPSTYIIDDPTFWDEVNDFDHEAIRKQAEECDFDF